METVLVSGDPNRIALRLHVERRDDRFHSTISLIDNRSVTPLLRSIEGGSDNPWPPSPPLQECLLQKVANRDVILATGMAGKTHWSVSVHAPESGAGFTWDVACRTGSEDFNLGTSYVFANGLRPTVINENQIVIQSGPSQLTLHPLPTDISPASMTYDGDSVAVTIRPAQPYPELPGTFRWKYELIVRDPRT